MPDHSSAAAAPAREPRGGERCAVRVLMVGPSLDILGGQAVQAAELLAKLREEQAVAVDFLPVNPRLPGFLRKLQRVKYLRTLVTWPWYCTTLAAAVRKHDVIHVFSASYSSFVLAPTPAILAARLFGKKVVLNYHSGEAEDHLARWRTARATMRLVDEIVVPSGYLVDVFRKFGFQARAIFNIIETGRFRFRERRPPAPVFLSNRNLEPLYNVGCILRAFAAIRQRYPEAQLLIAGDGSERAGLERLAGELGLCGAKFLSRVPHEEMPDLYDAADIYLNASDVDNMPLSILEAFACGLPVVSTDAGGIPYIVSDMRTGLLVGRRDHEAMAAKAIRLLEDDSLAWRLAHNALMECSKYRWDAVREGWLDLYHGLADVGPDRL